MEKKSKPSLVGEEDEAHLPQNPLSQVQDQEIPSSHSQEQIPVIILDFILHVGKKMKLLLPNPPQGVSYIPVLVSNEHLIYSFFFWSFVTHVYFC